MPVARHGRFELGWDSSLRFGMTPQNKKQYLTEAELSADSSY
jgi:hypothetical protein